MQKHEKEELCRVTSKPKATCNLLVKSYKVSLTERKLHAIDLNKHFSCLTKPPNILDYLLNTSLSLV